MIDEKIILKTLKTKIDHAKRDDGDFVYIPVWMAKELLENFAPMIPSKTILGYVCPVCYHRLVNKSYYQQKHCDECGQSINWTEVKA